VSPLETCQACARFWAAGTVRVDPRHFRSAAAVTSGRHLRITSAGAAPQPSLVRCHADSMTGDRLRAVDQSCRRKSETCSAGPACPMTMVDNLTACACFCCRWRSPRGAGLWRHIRCAVHRRRRHRGLRARHRGGLRTAQWARQPHRRQRLLAISAACARRNSALHCCCTASQHATLPAGKCALLCSACRIRHRDDWQTHGNEDLAGLQLTADVVHVADYIRHGGAEVSAQA
jgi:hypothetical protein